MDWAHRYWAVCEVQHPWQQGGRGDLPRPERSAEAGVTVLLCCDTGNSQRVTRLYWLCLNTREKEWPQQVRLSISSQTFTASRSLGKSKGAGVLSVLLSQKSLPAPETGSQGTWAVISEWNWEKPYPEWKNNPLKTPRKWIMTSLEMQVTAVLL